MYSNLHKALSMFGPAIIIRNVSTKRLYKSNMRRYCSIRVRLIILSGSEREVELMSLETMNNT